MRRIKNIGLALVLILGSAVFAGFSDNESEKIEEAFSWEQRNKSYEQAFQDVKTWFGMEELLNTIRQQKNQSAYHKLQSKGPAVVVCLRSNSDKKENGN